MRQSSLRCASASGVMLCAALSVAGAVENYYEIQPESEPIALAHLAGDVLEFQLLTECQETLLKLEARDGSTMIEETFDCGVAPHVALNALDDGAYTYELRLLQEVSGETTSESEIIASAVQGGHLLLMEGVPHLVVDADELLGHEQDGPGAVSTLSQTQRVVESHFTADLGTAAQMCAGCASDFEPQDEPLHLISPEPGIRFQSDATASPARLWEVDVTTDNRFVIEDDTGSDIVNVEDGAPANSVYVDSGSGNIGFGTTTPATELHVLSGSPELRLDQTANNRSVDFFYNGSVFDLELNFGGARTDVFSIKTASQTPDSSLVIASDGRIALGHESPSADLDVRDRSGTTGARILLELDNMGAPGMDFRDRNRNLIWRLIQAGNGMGWNLIGTGGFDFLVPNAGGFRAGRGGSFTIRGFANGNLSIDGVLTQLSSRSSKQGIEAVDGRELLHKLANLPLATWTYRTDDASTRHLGPMAGDFHQTFGLGADERSISPSDMAGVALAALQGMHAMVKEKDAEIAALKARIEALEAAQYDRRVAALEAAVRRLVTNRASPTQTTPVVFTAP